MGILEELVYCVFHCHYCMRFLRPCCWNHLCCWPLKPSPVVFCRRWSSYVNTSKYGSCLMDGSSVTSLTAFSPWTWWRLCRSQGMSSLPKWLEWTATTISIWDREKCTFPYQPPGWFCWTGTVFFICWYVWNTLFFFFFLIHAQKLQIWLVQIDQRASAEVLCQYLKLQDLWCYAVSSIFVVPSCPRHGAQSFVVAWLLPLSLELGTVQVLRMRKGNWDTSLWVNKRVWRAPMSLRLSGENCLSGKLCSINMSSMCFLVGSNKCLTTIPVSCR